jgi:transcriptional regulator of aromatic amino acid metabolism
LKVIYIPTPSLRDVPERHSSGGEAFSVQACQAMNTEPKQFILEILNSRTRHYWRGSARQSENEVKQLVGNNGLSIKAQLAFIDKQASIFDNL